MDDTRKWSRKQHLIALGVPSGMMAAAAVVLWVIPDRHFMTGISRTLALLAIAFNLLAAVWSAYTLAAIQRMGRQALQSRDVLVQQFARGQRWLPRNVMGIAVLLLVGFCSLPVAAAPLFTGRFFLMCLLIGPVLFAAGLWTLFRHVYPAITRRDDEDAGIPAAGRAVSRSEAPLVWKLVDEVTRKARVVAPDNIILGLDASFYATQSPLYLNHANTPITGRSMYLSVPYLAYLSRDEAAVIIGHELAHFTGADTEYSLKFSGIYSRAQQHYQSFYVEDKEGDEVDYPWINLPARALLAYYLSAFDLAVQHWSREREFLADRIGADAASPEAAALALARITALSSVIEEVLFEFVAHGGRTSHPGGLLEQVFDAVRSVKTLDPMQHLQDCQPHPRDSHPPTAQRIEALGVIPSLELVEQADRREPGTLLQELGLK